MFHLVDLHCHLDLYPNFQGAIEYCERNQIFTIAVTTVPAAWPQNKALLQGKKFIRPALGMHPQLANDRNADIKVWDRYFDEAKYIGEIGLDAGPKFYSSFAIQEANFEHILSRCALSGGKVLTVHSVRTAKKVLDHLERTNVLRENKVILHWFTGTPAEARRAAELGCFFSVNIQMLRSPRSTEILSAIPLDRIVTETDGPFIEENSKPISPGGVDSCLRELSMKLDMGYENIAEQVFKNFISMIR